MTHDLVVDTDRLRVGAADLREAAQAFRGELADSSCLSVPLGAGSLGTSMLAQQACTMAGQRVRDAVSASLGLHEVSRFLADAADATAASFDRIEQLDGPR